MAVGRSSFGTQANALLRKNLTYQKRNICETVRLVLFPLLLCVLILFLQAFLIVELDKPDFKCGCKIIDKGNGKKEEVCGPEYSKPEQMGFCAITKPPEMPPILQVPAPNVRAVANSSNSFTGLANASCRNTSSCPATFLFTGQNRTFGNRLLESMFADMSNSSQPNIVLGSDSWLGGTYYSDNALFSNDSLYYLQPKCTLNATISIPMETGLNGTKEVKCLEGLKVWRNTSAEINDEIYKGHKNSTSVMAGAFDFLNSNLKNFNVTIIHKPAGNGDDTNSIPLSRVPRAVNLISNIYLQRLLGPSVEMTLEFTKEVPKHQTNVSIDLSSLLGPLFFTWVFLLLFPVVLTALVYEKQEKLRIMMKMHGLSDGPYWMITYGYFLALSTLYVFSFIFFGCMTGMDFFLLNDFTLQFVFYFIYINLQIAMAFLASAWFSNTKTAAVVGYIIVFGTGLLGGFLFASYVNDTNFSRNYVMLMELYPGFALYRGLMELANSSRVSAATDNPGMSWKDLGNSENGLAVVFIIMSVEWVVFLSVAYYIDQVLSSGSGVSRSPLFFLDSFRKKSISSPSKKAWETEVFKVPVEPEKPDVAQEREKVDQLLHDPSSHVVVCDNLKKMYPKRDGNPVKYAVKGMSLALPRGECFGMLGPNGAGKTSFISMMIGLIEPTSGSAYVDGLDIRTQMNEVYTNMGVCPQHDLLWATLTGREHLLFYGRLKNLKGTELTKAVEESLAGVNLNGKVADKQSGAYSGGMKRRLSVAIALIGDPTVVYMDEPSTGLDPGSRNSLWNVVKKAKQNRAIILTTHSMEEAEYLCDRLGVFVDGSLQCIGNSKELKARYGGSYVFTMTTSADHEDRVENMVRSLCPSASKVYHLSGTQKFELSKEEVRIADVFDAVEKAKAEFTVYAWGLADTTLEDVFIKVARGAQSSTKLF